MAGGRNRKSNANKNTSLDEVHDLLLSLQKDQKESNEKIDRLLKEIKAKDDKINSLESKVEVLEGNVAILINTVKKLERKCDDNEQYSRRTSLRISDIPSTGGREIGDKSIDLVVETVNQIRGVNIKKSDIDRAHRVGKVIPNATYPRIMIVKFKYWNTREMVYKGRKQLEYNNLFLDLTKRRLDLKKLAIDKVKKIEKVQFVFADINCLLCLKTSDEKFMYFSSEEELDTILASL